jgi:hypothetical protein
MNYNKVPFENFEKWNGLTNDQLKVGMNIIVGFLKVKKDQSALAAMAATPGQPTKVPTVTEPLVKVEEPVSEPVAKKETITTPPAEKKSIPEKTTEEKKVVTENKPPVVNTPVYTSNSNSNGGYFRSFYEESGKNAPGTGSIFKSTSGWQDSKYYALMNNVPVGTIIKVSNPLNNKMVFAKVLGELPDMRESVGLTVRISDAAASELGVGDGRFSIGVKY